jgi:ParB-like chromosome segregation protein Spo0J
LDSQVSTTLPKEIPVHPAAMLFPMMFGEDLGNLADDIAANGLMEPIVLYHGQILDGRNRLAACEMANVEPRFMEVDGELPSATIYVLSKNLHRRHLTTSQRAAIAAEIVPLLKEEAHRRKLSGLKNQQHASSTCFQANEDTKGSVARIAAEAVQVGHDSVEKAIRVKRDEPEVFEQIKRGEVTVNEAVGERERSQERRRLEKEGEPPKTYEPKTSRQKKLAEGQKERMIRGLSTVTGICRGLEEMDIRKVVSVCDEEERNTWIERAKELASQLRAFSVRLQKGF